LQIVQHILQIVQIDPKTSYNESQCIKMWTNHSVMRNRNRQIAVLQ